MAKKNIRSQIVKDLLADKERLNQQLKESADNTAKAFLAEAVKDSLKKMIKEDEDSYDEEEVETDTDVMTDDATTAAEPEAEDAPAMDAEVEDVAGADEEGTEADDVDAEADDDIWNDIEQYKDEDGEYDLTGMDKDSLIKVMKVMGPEDGVRIVKNDNGTLTLTDDETDKEYVIDMDGQATVEEPASDDVEEDDYEIDFDMDESVNEENLGYTTNYQKQTAMTTPSNNEPADKSKTYSMDGGIPTGTEKPYPGKGNIAPYDEKEVNEECEGAECQLDEVNTSTEMGPANRGVSMYHGNSNKKAARGRNSHEEGKQVKGTGENSYSGVSENIIKKANAIFNENKQLKELLPNLQKRIEEAIVINQSLANMVTLMCENSTTKDEKKSIMERFNAVKSREESNKLFKTISEELKRDGKNLADMETAIKGQQLSESKSNINEAPMYEDKSLNETKAFMARLARIK